MLNAGMFTSTTPEWATPPDLFAALDAEFHFTLDPCATSGNAKCATFFTKEQDGLRQSWAGHVVFMNPPYGREIGKWIQKAYREAQGSAIVVCLLPVRTDNWWFHECCLSGEIRFIRGRLKFGGCENSAPFPSMIVVFRAGLAAPRIADTQPALAGLL